MDINLLSWVFSSFKEQANALVIFIHRYYYNTHLKNDCLKTDFVSIR